MAKKATVETPALDLTPAEIQAVLKARESTGGSPNVAIEDLANALITAINATKTPEKKTPYNRKKGGPWIPKDGRPKPKLRRIMYQHGMEIMPESCSIEELELLNKIKPGSYCGGQVRVIKRKDRGIDIDYRMKTASERLRVLQLLQAGYEGETGFARLLNRLIAEAADPNKFKGPDEDDDDE